VQFNFVKEKFKTKQLGKGRKLIIGISVEVTSCATRLPVLVTYPLKRKNVCPIPSSVNNVLVTTYGMGFHEGQCP
jgi:hypothetical protein